MGPELKFRKVIVVNGIANLKLLSETTTLPSYHTKPVKHLNSEKSQGKTYMYWRCMYVLLTCTFSTLTEQLLEILSYKTSLFLTQFFVSGQQI
jgi:hypothetical protein